MTKGSKSKKPRKKVTFDSKRNLIYEPRESYSDKNSETSGVPESVKMLRPNRFNVISPQASKKLIEDQGLLLKELLRQTYPESKFSISVKKEVIIVKTNSTMLRDHCRKYTNLQEEQRRLPRYKFTQRQAKNFSNNLIELNRNRIGATASLIESMVEYQPGLTNHIVFKRKKSGEVNAVFDHAPRREQHLMNYYLKPMVKTIETLENNLNTIKDFSKRKKILEDYIEAIRALHPSAKLKISYETNGRPKITYSASFKSLLKRDKNLSSIVNETRLTKKKKIPNLRLLKTLRDARGVFLNADPHLRPYLAIIVTKGKPTLLIDEENLAQEPNIQRALKDQLNTAINDSIEASVTRLQECLEVTRKERKMLRKELEIHYEQPKKLKLRKEDQGHAIHVRVQPKKVEDFEEKHFTKADILYTQQTLMRRQQLLNSLCDAILNYRPDWKGKISLSFVKVEGFDLFRMHLKKLPKSERLLLTNVLHEIKKDLPHDANKVILDGEGSFDLIQDYIEWFDAQAKSRIEFESIFSLAKQADPSLKDKCFIKFNKAGKPFGELRDGSRDQKIKEILQNPHSLAQEKIQAITTYYYHRLVVGAHADLVQVQSL